MFINFKSVKCVTVTTSYHMMAALSQSQLVERLNVWKLQYLIWQEPFNSWSLKALTGAPLCWCLLVKSCLLRSQSPGVTVHEVMFAVEVGGCGPRRKLQEGPLSCLCALHAELNWLYIVEFRRAAATQKTVVRVHVGQVEYDFLSPRFSLTSCWASAVEN